MFKYNNLYDNLDKIHTEDNMLNLRSHRQLTAIILLTNLLFGISPASRAANEQRYYDIEIVLFQNNAALKKLPELVNEPQPLKFPEHFIQLGMPMTSETTDYIPEYYFKLLPSSDYKLNAAAEKITNSKVYRILKHFAWRQPGLAKEVALPIVFQDVIPAEIPESNANPEQPESLLYTQARLDGIITVSLSRYLHLESELRFEADGLPPLPETNPDFATTDVISTSKPRPTTVVYVEKQKRRMRSKELHYIDHPVFGMLVLMTPVELPPTATTTATTPKAKATR